MENNYLEHTEEDVNVNFDREMTMHKVKKELMQSYSEYRETIKKMSGDAPIAVLCLDKATENILLRNGFNRVYDLFDRDLTEIKGLGVARSGYLATRLDEFLAMF